MTDWPEHRAELLKGAPMEHAPENEQGVVFLFSALKKKLQLRIVEIQTRFPDCIAYQRTGEGEKRLRIEFEYRSREFQNHGHPVNGCDWIVCWINDWPEHPPQIKIIELRQYFGLGFNVWIQPIDARSKEQLLTMQKGNWSAAQRASKGDLVLTYKTRPEACISDVFLLSGPVEYLQAQYKNGWDYFAPYRRVCQLAAPVFLEDLRRHPVLKTSYFVRRSMVGRPNVTEYWPQLYEMIIRRNPSLKPKLKRFAPEVRP